MKRAIIAAVFTTAALFGVIALAETDTSPWKSIYEHFDFKVSARFRQNVNFDRSLAVTHIDAGTLTVNSLSFTPTGRGTLNYDFAPITGTHSRCLTAVTTSTATGCAFRDSVVWGADQTIAADIELFPFVSAANVVSLRACATGITDGGSADMPDASYVFTCIR